MLSALQQPDTCLHFLRPGRLVRIREGPLDWGWGIVVSVMRKAVAVNAAFQPGDMGPASSYILDLLLSCDPASVKGALDAFWEHYLTTKTVVVAECSWAPSPAVLG